MLEPVEELLAIEAIKNLKARYWYAMDTKDWDTVRELFTEDAIFDMRVERAFSRGEPSEDLPSLEESVAAGDAAVPVGASAIVSALRVDSWTTVHHGHAPIIEVSEVDFGTAIWPFFDYIDDGEGALKGYGHYHDEYRRVGGEWLLSHVLITRLRADGTYPSAQPRPGGDRG